MNEPYRLPVRNYMGVLRIIKRVRKELKLDYVIRGIGLNFHLNYLKKTGFLTGDMEKLFVLII